jgi:hypothetical protein
MMKAFILIGCSVFFMFACQSEADFISDAVPAMESEMELSHAPAGKVYIAASDIETDFGCDEYMASHILSEYGQPAIDSINTRGGLIRFYEARRPSFEYQYSSSLNPFSDNDYVFPKLEYLLAQECLQDNCSSQTRKAVLRIAVDKQKQKYAEYGNSFTARRTGLFLMAVILVRENVAAFTSAVHKHTDFQNALLLSIDIRPDKEFSDEMIRYAENFLYNK